jgi:two-component system chemotaxis sensor kinase CheA
MNDDLLEQFITEGRELLAEAVEDLLALERAPDDKERINRLFRSIHTVKGSSGLFDLPPITRLLHAGEDMFQAVRERGLKLTPDMVDASLAAVDLVTRWIDELERTEILPADAGALATGLAARLRTYFDNPATAAPAGIARAGVAPSGVAPSGAAPAGVAAASANAPVPSETPQLDRWFSAATLAQLARSGEKFHLIVYQPSESCFFKGEDPLHLALQTPNLAALAWAWRNPCAPLSELDPYQCNLDFFLLSSATPEALAANFRYAAQDVTFLPLPPGSFSAAAPVALPDITRDLLQFCTDMLAHDAPPAEQPGRFAAARRVAANALRAAGLTEAAVQLAEADSPDTCRQSIAVLLATGAAARPAIGSAAESAATGIDTPAEPAAEALHEAPNVRKVLRVDKEKFDVLMNLIGELVVAKNSLPFLAKRADEQYGARALAREIKDEYGVIDRIAQELQGAVMAVSMMPVGQVFGRFPRLVRDLARKLGKQVDLVITGEDTEADKNVIETLFDPLLHMVRNSLDHGIEPPDERVACGKRPSATLTLAARQDGDQAVIEIIDDGRGIDPAMIKRKAYERGLIDETRLATISDQDAAMLIFAAGFSTAETISDVSGRGVGMDVVRAAVEKAGGAITLSSVKHQGTTLRLSLPLSMAVTRVMTVLVEGRLFGIPMDLVLETVKLPAHSITRIKNAKAFLLRDQIIPLRHLNRLLHLPDPQQTPAEIAVLVVRTGGQLLGLGISAFGEVMEVILKPMDGVLARIAGYSGTCLLGDGKVLLVLDLKELIA